MLSSLLSWMMWHGWFPMTSFLTPLVTGVVGRGPPDPARRGTKRWRLLAVVAGVAIIGAVVLGGILGSRKAKRSKNKGVAVLSYGDKPAFMGPLPGKSLLEKMLLDPANAAPQNLTTMASGAASASSTTDPGGAGKSSPSFSSAAKAASAYPAAAPASASCSTTHATTRTQTRPDWSYYGHTCLGGEKKGIIYAPFLSVLQCGLKIDFVSPSISFLGVATYLTF